MSNLLIFLEHIVCQQKITFGSGAPSKDNKGFEGDSQLQSTKKTNWSIFQT